MIRLFLISALIMWRLYFPVFAVAESIEEIEEVLLKESYVSEPEKLNSTKLEDKRNNSPRVELTIPASWETVVYKPKAKVIILNKITAKSETVKLKEGKTEIFGNISLELHKCAKNTDPLQPASLLLVTVLDNIADGRKEPVFRGWMDSANLSISTLEHPVYELIPVECVD